jgi:hypothetical protein
MIGDLYGVILATSEPGRALVRYTQADRTIVSAAHAHDDERADQKQYFSSGQYSQYILVTHYTVASLSDCMVLQEHNFNATVVF